MAITCPDDFCRVFDATNQAPRSHWASRSYSPPFFSMIVLKAIRNMKFPTEMYFLHRTVVYKQERKVAKSILKGAFSDLPRGVV